MKAKILEILHNHKHWSSSEDGYTQDDLIFDDGSFEEIAEEIEKLIKLNTNEDRIKAKI